MEDFSNNVDDAIEMSRSIRHAQPAYYICKIELFSVLVESGIEKYESDDFEARGYKWKLCLYPNGNKKRNGKNHISLYLAISDTTALAQGWEVNVQFKLFVYDHLLDKYLTIQDVGERIRRFHEMKTEWGFDQLLSLDIFNDESKGYLVDDNCAFGAEVFVHNYAGKAGQCLSMIKESKENTDTWKIDNFSKINEASPKIIEVSRSIRHVQPAHYICKIESFSMLVESGIERHESDNFEVGGYKWKLCLYPNGNKKRNGKNHISLYLAISDTTALPQGWEVNAQFKLFVYDHLLDKYLTIQDVGERIRRFHGMKTEWGFDQLLSLDIFNDELNGYLVDDNCAFGAEVFVSKYAGKGQCLSMIKESKENTYTWKIDNFLTKNEAGLYSEEFEAGARKWKLYLYPKSDVKGKGRSLSLYLGVADYATLPPKWKVYAKYKLRIRDQLQTNHFERETSGWRFSDSNWKGFYGFMLLSDLNDTSKGFIVNNTIIIETEISITANVKNFN